MCPVCLQGGKAFAIATQDALDYSGHPANASICIPLPSSFLCRPNPPPHTPHPQETKTPMSSLPITPAALNEMLALIEDGTISGKIAKEVLPDLLQGRGNTGARWEGRS